MTSMNTMSIDKDIRELTFDETECVSGGWIPVAVALIAAAGAIIAASISSCTSDDCTTTSETKGGKTTSKTTCN